MALTPAANFKKKGCFYPHENIIFVFIMYLPTET